MSALPYQRHPVLSLMLASIVLLSLVPASQLVARRIQAEAGANTVTLLMDERALQEQADMLATDSLTLATQYQAAGLQGIILYEDTLESLAAQGVIDLAHARELRTRYPGAEIPSNSVLASERQAGALDAALRKYQPSPQRISIDNRVWYVFPGELADDVLERPMGIDPARVERWQAAGFDLAYRPINYPKLQQVGADFPTFPTVRYLIHEGDEVAGNPESLESLVEVSQGYFTGLVEGLEQAGMERIMHRVPLIRTFSIAQDWLNTLEPAVVADKFALATRERGAKLLYLRPYTEEKSGGMVSQTLALVEGINNKLQHDGYRIGSVERVHYQSTPLLRWLSAAGVVAGLGLLLLIYPLGWGMLVVAGISGLCVLLAGISWDALALCAALCFPVLAYALLPQRWYSYFGATAISLIGAWLLMAVGSDQAAMIAAEPFAGVGATLLIPPLLFIVHWLLAERRAVDWVRQLWGYRIRLGDVAIVLLGMMALALVLLRRSNFPIIGVTSNELALRDMLGQYFARPRFKELLGHPLAVLALSNPRWALWMRGMLLTGGVVAQATILNSFSHYHTPVMISLERTIAALILGGALGFVLVPVSHFVVGWIRNWLATAST